MSQVSSPIEKRQLQPAGGAVNQLLVAIKAYSVYAGNHPNRKQAVSRLHTALVSFLQDYGPLQITIEREGLHYEGVAVHSGTGLDADLGFSALRDGLKWLRFDPGLSLPETEVFVWILHQHRQPEEESGDDLVTALWEAGPAHIRYQATELSLEDDLA